MGARPSFLPLALGKRWLMEHQVASVGFADNVGWAVCTCGYKRVFWSALRTQHGDANKLESAIAWIAGHIQQEERLSTRG